jgi:hypothetical protein
VFGIEAANWKGSERLVFDAKVLGYPRLSLADIPAGTYRVQALLHRYETFHRKDGHVVQLPMDRGEGQNWSLAPGNLYSTVQEIKFDPADPAPVALVLDKVIEPIKPPADTEWVRHERIQSKLLTEFWGRPMYLGAHVLLPKGWAEHPKARYPLMINHGHFPDDFGGFRTEPPDPDLKPEYSDRFRLDGYNRLEQEFVNEAGRCVACGPVVGPDRKVKRYYESLPQKQPVESVAEQFGSPRTRGSSDPYP